MSSIKQKLCNKIGITESSLKGNNLFSPYSTTNKSYETSDKNYKGEKAIKFFSSANSDKKRTSLGATPYQNYKIDILVPNSEPPKPLIGVDTAKNYYRRHVEGNSALRSPLKSTMEFSSSMGSTKRSANQSHLESLSSNMKLSNTEGYNPVSKAKQGKDKEVLSKS